MLLHHARTGSERVMGTAGVARLGQTAEWVPARLVLVCEPAIEALFGVVETDPAGFACPFSIPRAALEHRTLRRRLEAAGARVVDVREVLAHGDTEVLREAARRAFACDLDERVDGGERADVALHHERTVQALDPETLATLVMLRPTAHVRRNPDPLGRGSGFRATFEVDPLSDACFVRDPLLVTAAGVAIGRPHLEARRAEADLAELVLRQLGAEPVVRVVDPGHVEGGDLLAAGSFALIGQGPVSDEDGIGQLLDAGAFGDVEVGVVRDPRTPDDGGRLDRSLTLFGPTLAGICEDRLGSGQPEVDVYTPEPTMAGRRYRRKRVAGLLEYLRSKGFHILTFTVAERMAFASGGLTLGPMHYLAPASAGDTFLSRLRDHGVLVQTLPFSELGAEAGGPRRSTQVLSRTQEPRRR